MTKQPNLSAMIEANQWLSIRCTQCAREKALNAYEAAHRYGHDLTVPEVRAVIRARCRSADCNASVGIALDHEIPKLLKAKVP